MSWKKNEGKYYLEPFEKELERLFHKIKKAAKEAKETEEVTKFVARVKEIKNQQAIIEFSQPVRMTDN